MDSLFVEASLLVGQIVLVVVSLGQVHLNSIFVELVASVPQSLLEVGFVGQVNPGLLVVEDAFRSLVELAIFVGECLLQVLSLAEVFQDGEVVVLAVLVNQSLVVELDILEFLGSGLLCFANGFLVLGQMNVSVLRFSTGGLMGVLVGGLEVSRLGGHRGLRDGSSLQRKFV